MRRHRMSSCSTIANAKVITDKSVIQIPFPLRCFFLNIFYFFFKKFCTVWWLLWHWMNILFSNSIQPSDFSIDWRVLGGSLITLVVSKWWFSNSAVLSTIWWHCFIKKRFFFFTYIPSFFKYYYRELGSFYSLCYN